MSLKPVLGLSVTIPPFLLLLIALVLPLSLATSSSSSSSAELQLSNGRVVAGFSPTNGCLTSLQLPSFPSPIPFLTDDVVLTLNDSLTLRCSTLNATTRTATSLTFTYLCPPSLPFLITSTYSLQPGHSFIAKQTTLINTTAKAGSSFHVTHAQQSLTFPPSTFDDSGTLHNNLWQPGHDHAIFLRTHTAAGSAGVFAAFQSPFASISSNGGGEVGRSAAEPMVFNFSYAVGLPVSNVYGEAFALDGFVIGGYILDTYWHLNPPPASTDAPQIERSDSLNYAERSAFTECVETFWVGPPRQTSVRVAVGWDSNDFAIDIDTAPGVEEYRRLVDRCSDVGISHLIFAPQNSAVSSRYNATDAWGWEEALWLTLGEHLRTGVWVPGRDAVPPTIQSMLDYAASRHVRLMAYVYPPLGFRAPGDSAWLYGGGCCASLAVPEFQRYLASTLVTFARVTGIGGYAFDYNSYGDSSHTTYAQWKGWHWVLRQLRDTFPDFVMDHRQIAHVEGPWSWLTGSYAEPLQSDENPESLAPAALPSLHYDHSVAYWLRGVNWNYRIMQLAPYATIPGFIGHQTERSYPNGSLAWSDSYIRDFDLMGFPYSLLSTVASAGLNLVHTMLPARDLREYALLPASALSFWKQWLDWPTQHRAELEQAIPLSAPGIDQVDGWVTMQPNGWLGHVFLFNPNLPRLNATLVMTDAMLLRPPPLQLGTFLLSEVYPRPAVLRTFQYGDTVNFTLDGDSATVYELRLVLWAAMPGPTLVGAAGVVQVMGDTLRVDGVSGEAGTSSGPVNVFMRRASDASAIQVVLVNGVSVSFGVSGNEVAIEQSLSFPGMYLPRSAQLGTVPPHFVGGAYSVPVRVSQELLDQLSLRAASYPIEWTEEELSVGWLAPHRLLAFISIVAPDDRWNVTATLDGASLRVYAAYTSRHPVRSCFQGFFVDLSGRLAVGKARRLELQLPTMAASQFKGVFLQNIEPIMALANVTSPMKEMREVSDDSGQTSKKDASAHAASDR